MVKLVLFGLSLSIATHANAINRQAVKYIPGGTVVQEKLREIKVQTPKGSIVEVEFNSDGSFEEASGDDLARDVFIPDDGMLPLEKAIASLKKQGKTPVKGWEFEHSFLRGWYYKFEGYENRQGFDYIVDAKNGDLIESKLDD